ncbi:TPA: helix-turn-helix domain-containing protein, partial [Streptococcus suis]|nr:helix-turn-helix domain-containing protein [Streptococcus suis]
MGKEVSEKLKILDSKPRLKALFIFLFRSEDFVTSSYIAETLNVTSRTIKSDINELKSCIQDLGSIESKRSFGYKLHINNPSYIEQIKELFQIFPSVKLENEKDTFVLYILRRLVSS